MRKEPEIKGAIERVRILGAPVDNVDMEGALSFVDEYVRNGKTGGYILAVNPEKVFVLRQRPLLKALFDRASLLVPDGIGVVLAVRLLYGRRTSRVPGADLMQNICRHAREKNYKIFVYGSKEEVNREAVARLRASFPGIRIVGRSDGYVSEDQMSHLLDSINKSEADILFVALGSPKQELWIDQYLSRLNVKICQGIGGTLDTLVGEVKRAPKIFRKAGLEWFYRLLSDPRRIRRQLVLPIFAIEVLKERLKQKAAV
jgi:N-acetylglucosaminyldiphosphoundecaprenol N-acetyl-beta-D-mannosaminyltransferase